MIKKSITIMIVSTIPDMFSEHYYFIKHVFPELKDICNNHDIDLEYVDLFFSMSDKEINHCRSIRKYFESIDLDRTFFLCFRGQKLGCAPTPEDIDKMTLEKYPELVDYIGDISFTELIVMHALHPFERCSGGKCEFLSPVKHSLFYFRNDSYLNQLSCSQREIYTCSDDCDDEFVRDLKLAMAKDLVFNDKHEFDNKKEVLSRINIRKYDGVWDNNLDLREVLIDYAEEYANLKNLYVNQLLNLVHKVDMDNSKGSFTDFTCENRQLKDVMIEDFLNELKLEFPDDFN